MTSVAALLLLALLPWVIGREPHDWHSLEEAQRHERKHELGGFFVRFGENLKTTDSAYLTETARCKCECGQKCLQDPECYAYYVKPYVDIWMCSYYNTVGEYEIEESSTSRTFFSIKLEIDGWRKGFDDLYYISPNEKLRNWTTAFKFCSKKGALLAIIKTMESFFFTVQESGKLLRENPGANPVLAINMRKIGSDLINGDNSSVIDTQVYKKNKFFIDQHEATVFGVFYEFIHDVPTDFEVYPFCQRNILGIKPY